MITLIITLIIIILITFLFKFRSESLSNIFLILSRNVTPDLYNKYSKLGLKNLIFISDTKPNMIRSNVIYYDDEELISKNFIGLEALPMKPLRKDNIKIVNAWEKAFYYLSNNFSSNNYYWIIEDDCYLNKYKFKKFVNENNILKYDVIFFGWYKEFSKGEDIAGGAGTSKNKNWLWWRENKLVVNKFRDKDLKGTNNQIIRLSSKCVRKILDFQKYNKRFLFHEMLIPSIVSKYNLKKIVLNSKQFHITALKKNSIINKKRINEKKIIRFLDKNYIFIHPLKLWYKL